MTRRYTHPDLRVGLKDIRIANKFEKCFFEPNDLGLLLFSEVRGLVDQGFDGVEIALVTRKYMVSGFC